MNEKPTTSKEYPKEQVELVRSTCLYVATILGDYMEDVVIVGGLVPSLLIDQDSLPAETDRHVGTIDLDVGLSLAIFEGKKYEAIAERLRKAGFSQDISDQGNLTRQRWQITGPGKVTVDFLIPPASAEDEGGRIRDIEQDFAAVITPGLRLAFTDRQKITLSGMTIRAENATRDIWVCGAGAFVVLKALAFRNRGEKKDAYDLYYHIRNYRKGIEDIADALKPMLQENETKDAIKILREDFTEHNSVGASRVAEFLTGGKDDAIQADVAGFVNRFLDLCKLEET
jgi:hypothetical protein